MRGWEQEGSGVCMAGGGVEGETTGIWGAGISMEGWKPSVVKTSCENDPV